MDALKAQLEAAVDDYGDEGGDEVIWRKCVREGKGAEEVACC